MWAAALNYGPRPVDEGIARCEELLQRHANDRASEAGVLLYLSRLRAMCGDFEQARATIESARAIYEELGQTFAATALGGASSAAIEVLADNPSGAETELREACETCLHANATAHLASYSGKLADVLYLLGRLEEAEEWCSRSRELARPDDRDAQAWWRSVTAKLVARRGDVQAAAELAAEALAVVEQTDALNLHAKVALDYAEVLRADGRRADAAHAVLQAIRLYELKGNRVAAARARALPEVSAVAST
jgi:tetratricopeptide (TPR) repeat protein